MQRGQKIFEKEAKKNTKICSLTLQKCPDVNHALFFFSGVGIATMVMVTYYNIYYCVIVAWSLYYFVASFVAIPDLPWNTCGNPFNDKNSHKLKTVTFI